MLNEMLIVAAADTIWTRLGVCTVATVVGVGLIMAGRYNIKSQTASETGKRRFVNNAIGASNNYEGSKAVMIGWVRVICGIGLIIFGIAFIFVGPFLVE